MGKKTDLWDDSALINAFENAITKYKVMHSDQYQVKPAEEENIASANDEIGPSDTDDVSAVVQNGDCSHMMNGATETCLSHHSLGASDELPSVQENHHNGESSAPQPDMPSANGILVQENSEDYQDIQGAEYNKLLGQYYELEQQRQKILQQLHQASGWNYQSFPVASDSCVPWNLCCSTSQSPQVTTCDASCPFHFSSCCPYACHCLAAPPYPVASCALGAQCVANNGTHTPATSCTVDPVKMTSFAEDNVTKKAMGAAEKAIASMKFKESVNSNICEDIMEGKTQCSAPSDTLVSQNISSETDLTEVLNAWYSAGFYTGKYLSEQSFTRRQHT